MRTLRKSTTEKKKTRMKMSDAPRERLRGLPSVEQLLQTQKAAALIAANGRPMTLEAIRSVLSDLREKIRAQGEADVLPQAQVLPQAKVLLRAEAPGRAEILDAVNEKLDTWLRP